MAKRRAVQDPEDNYELREKVHKTDKYDISVMNDVVAFDQTRVAFGHVFMIHSVVRSSGLCFYVRPSPRPTIQVQRQPIKCIPEVHTCVTPFQSTEISLPSLPPTFYRWSKRAIFGLINQFVIPKRSEMHHF